MKIPEFTAEKSVYKTDDHYRMLRKSVSIAGGREVIPQMLCYYDLDGNLAFCILNRGGGPQYIM